MSLTLHARMEGTVCPEGSTRQASLRPGRHLQYLLSSKACTFPRCNRSLCKSGSPCHTLPASGLCRFPYVQLSFFLPRGRLPFLQTGGLQSVQDAIWRQSLWPSQRRTTCHMPWGQKPTKGSTPRNTVYHLLKSLASHRGKQL